MTVFSEGSAASWPQRGGGKGPIPSPAPGGILRLSIRNPNSGARFRSQQAVFSRAFTGLPEQPRRSRCSWSSFAGVIEPA
jgi:hypothetical protein